MNYTLQIGFESTDGTTNDYIFHLWVWEDEDIIIHHQINYRLVDGKFEECPGLTCEAVDSILYLAGLKRDEIELEATKKLSDNSKMDHVFWSYSLELSLSLKSLDVYYE